jgi:hypothetical protein
MTAIPLSEGCEYEVSPGYIGRPSLPPFPPPKKEREPFLLGLMLQHQRTDSTGKCLLAGMKEK